MNISTGGPHILLFERDQQLTTLLVSELQLAGYECHTARTAVEVFDAIARYPVRLVLVNLAQAATARREFWVALDSQRRDRKVQVFTFRCENIAGYGQQDPDDHLQGSIADMEFDGMLGLMSLVDAVRARVPGSNSEMVANTMPRVPKATPLPATTPRQSAAPQAPINTNNGGFRNSYQADGMQNQNIARGNPASIPQPPPGNPTANMQVDQDAFIDNGSMNGGPGANQATYSDKIRAVLYPNQRNWNTPAGTADPIGAFTAQVPTSPAPPDMSTLQGLANGQIGRDNHESGLAQLSRIAQGYQAPKVEENYNTTSFNSLPYRTETTPGLDTGRHAAYTPDNHNQYQPQSPAPQRATPSNIPYEPQSPARSYSTDGYQPQPQPRRTETPGPRPSTFSTAVEQGAQPPLTSHNYGSQGAQMPANPLQRANPSVQSSNNTTAYQSAAPANHPNPSYQPAPATNNAPSYQSQPANNPASYQSNNPAAYQPASAVSNTVIREAAQPDGGTGGYKSIQSANGSGEHQERVNGQSMSGTGSYTSPVNRAGQTTNDNIGSQPMRASPIQGIPAERGHTGQINAETLKRPDVLSRTNYGQQSTQQPTAATNPPLASITATPAKTPPVPPLSMIDKEELEEAIQAIREMQKAMELRGTIPASKTSVEDDDESDSYPWEQTDNKPIPEETRNQGKVTAEIKSEPEFEATKAPSNAVLLDIVQSFPPMNELPKQGVQPQVLNGRASRSLGNVLLDGHLVPQDRLEVAQNIQRMLSGVDLNYQLGDILLMFKLLTPDQLLAANLMSYGLITTTQIGALGRIRQELHSVGLEYDLENLIILFRILTAEQLREVRTNLPI